MVVVDLLYNLSILVALSVLSAFLDTRFDRKSFPGQLFQGILFGAIAVVGMMRPFVVEKGLIFDGRTIVLSLCSFFYGPLSGLIASIMALVYRYTIGGPGLLMGLTTILSSFGLGLVFRKKRPITIGSLYLLGLSVHVVMLLLVLTLPKERILSTYRDIGFTILAIYPVVTLLIGKVLLDQEERGLYIAELREREARYRFLTENLADMVWTTDLDFRPQYISPSVKRLLGYTPEEWSEHSLSDALTPESYRVLIDTFRRELAREGERGVDPDRTVTIELACYHRTGGLVWLESTVRWIRDEAGRPIGIHGVSRDVTERKRMAELLDVAVQAAGLGLWDQDFRTGTITRNAQWAHMLGYTPEEIASDLSAFFRLLHPDDRKRVEAVIQDHEAGRIDSFRVEHRLKAKDGRWKWILNVGRIVERDSNGRPLRASGIHLDVTDLKKAEEALRESEERYRLLAETAQDFILVHDMQGRISYANAAGLSVTGFRIDEIQGKSILDLIPEEYHPLVRSNAEKRKAGDHTRFQYEIEIWDHAGHRIPVEVNSTPILRGETIQGILIVARDITERKKARLALEENLRAKELLLRELYHRTKNNMQVISAMIRLRARTIQDPAIHSIFQELENKIQTMALVHQKLYESQDLSSINLKRYIIDLIGLIRQGLVVDDRKVHFIFEGPDFVIPLEAAVPLGLVINELLTNAIKYAFPGDRSGTIAVRFESLPQEGMILKVSDDGVGFPQGFDAFRDGHLGLRTVIELVKRQLGGEIFFHQGRGVTCEIRLRITGDRPDETRNRNISS